MSRDTNTPPTRITRAYLFEAAHFLPNVPEGHRCRNMHGHNYRVEVTFEGQLDERGFVIDFYEVDQLMNPLIAQLDHKVLNEVEGLENPTAEMIAHWLLAKLPNCARIKVCENDTSWAEIDVKG